MAAKKTYLDIYPDCNGCPHRKYCGLMVGSIKLCNSYEEREKKWVNMDYTTGMVSLKKEDSRAINQLIASE